MLSREVESLGIKVTIIEPGGFRTDWASSSMSYTEPSEDYHDTVGRRLDLIRGLATRAPGDPAKAAQAIITVVNEPNPPIRLLLGSDAIRIVRQADQAKLAEIDRWEKLSTSTNFDDANLAEHEELVRTSLNLG